MAECNYKSRVDNLLNNLSNSSNVVLDYKLDNVTQAVALLNLKPKAKIITVAGTNGKGSTVHALKYLALAAKLKVATFTSPHLHCVCERININDADITYQDLFYAITYIMPKLAEQKIAITYFELLFLAALYLFQQQKLDLIILEVGIGGRLDATNSIKCDMAIIVTINYDHCHILGNTLKQILSEKAGILHTNCTLGASKEIDKEGYLASLVDKLGITWWEPQGTIPIITNLTYPSINAYLAVTALDKLFNLKSLLEMKEIIKVLKTHQPMARFEKFTWQTHTIILDVAHNPESVANLMQKLQTQSYNLVNALFCVKDTKDFMEILKISKPYIHKWLLPLNEEFGPIAKVLKPHLNAIFVPLDIKLILQDLPDNSTLVVFGTFPLVANVRTQIINEINFVNKG